MGMATTEQIRGALHMFAITPHLDLFHVPSHDASYKCDIVAECEPCIGCDHLVLVTDGVWEGEGE